MTVFLGRKQRDGSAVSIDGNARRKHMAIFGKSGVGKTTLMRNMIVADLDAGNGVPKRSTDGIEITPLDA